MSNNNNQQGGGKKNKKNNKKGGDDEPKEVQQTQPFTFDSASKQVNFNFSTAPVEEKSGKGGKKGQQQQQPQQQQGGKKGKKQPEPEPEEEEEDEEEEDDEEGYEGLEGDQIDIAEMHKRIQEQIEKDLKEKTDAFIAALPPVVQQRVKVIQNFQEKIKNLREDYDKEVKALTQKYEKLYAPYNQKRAEIVAGEREPTDEEFTSAAADKSIKSADVKGIPDFWITVLKNHPTFADMIQERDEAAMKYLRDVTAEDFEKDEKEGFVVHFHFTENPFFENKVLSKTYTAIDDQGQLLIDSVEGTDVVWKADQDLTVNKIKKKQRHKSGKGTRVVIKSEPCDSFFNFFKTPEDDEMVEELLEAEYDLGQTLKEDILPEVVDWYLGAISPMMPFGEDDEEDYDDEDGEDRDEDDEEDDEDDEPKQPAPKGGKAGNKKGSQAAQGPEGQANPECKQQ